MYIINDFLGTYGGSTTLILRMAEWIKENNRRLKIYTPSDDNREIIGKLEKLNVQIEIFETGDLKQLKQHIDSDCEKERSIFISFTMNSFLNIEIIKKNQKDSIKINNIIYPIHPNTFLKGYGYSNKLINYTIKARYALLIKKMCESHCVISMDEDIIQKTEEYYNVTIKENIHIQRLPIACKDIEENVLRKKLETSYNSRTIITASRAEFPYKGYILGLIDDFEKMAKKNLAIKLEIVCSGEKECVDLIMKKIKALDDDIRIRINYHSWMDYQELKKHMSRSCIFIGMGTSVIDAAAEYVPSIAVKYNTYENIADSIFYENPFSITSYSGNGKDVMERILKFDFPEYFDVSIKCHNAVKNYYNIDDFFNYIDCVQNKNSFLTFSDVALYLINRFVKGYKNKEEFSCKNIEREDE